MAKSFSLDGLVNTGGDEETSDSKPEQQGATELAPKRKVLAKKAEPAPVVTAPSKRLSLTLDGETYRVLRLHAVETDRTHQDILAEAVGAYLRKYAGT